MDTVPRISTSCRTNIHVRKDFFVNVTPWNSLKINPDTVHSIATLKSLINSSDLSEFLHFL